MTSYVVVSACDGRGWETYGQRMVETFCQYWPAEIPLTLYVQNFVAPRDLPIAQVDLHVASPWLLAWKACRTKSEQGVTENGRYEFKRDAVTFSNKVAALELAAAETKPGDTLIWLDADTLTHAKVTIGWLDELFPGVESMAWLERNDTYPETSCMMFRMPECDPLLEQLAWMYRSGEMLDLPELHDAYVLQTLVKRCQVEVASLSGEGRKYLNAFVNSPLSTRMDHLKGKRKAQNRSPLHERKIRDKAPYWR